MYSDTMMTSSNRNIFRVTGPLCGEFTGPGEFRGQRPVTLSFDVFFDLRLINGWVNNREAGDLRHHRAHYDVIVMTLYNFTYWITKEQLEVRFEILFQYHVHMNIGVTILDFTANWNNQLDNV